MADDDTRRSHDEEPLEIESDDEDLEETMRQAVAAVEEVERSGDASDDVLRLEGEIADLRDRSIRTLADFDNYRKRVERERAELRRFGSMEALRDLLEVVDNLERAAIAGGSAEDLKRGVEMILRQLQETLRRHGVSSFESLGQPFDPGLHEAVSRQESPGAPEPSVAEELQAGYRLHDRLLRPARVVVAVPTDDGGDSP